MRTGGVEAHDEPDGEPPPPAPEIDDRPAARPKVKVWRVRVTRHPVRARVVLVIAILMLVLGCVLLSPTPNDQVLTAGALVVVCASLGTLVWASQRRSEPSATRSSSRV